jgi:hypothetical protein
MNEKTLNTFKLKVNDVVYDNRRNYMFIVTDINYTKDSHKAYNTTEKDEDWQIHKVTTAHNIKLVMSNKNRFKNLYIEIFYEYKL